MSKSSNTILPTTENEELGGETEGRIGAEAVEEHPLSTIPEEGSTSSLETLPPKEQPQNAEIDIEKLVPAQSSKMVKPHEDGLEVVQPSQYDHSIPAAITRDETEEQLRRNFETLLEPSRLLIFGSRLTKTVFGGPHQFATRTVKERIVPAVEIGDSVSVRNEEERERREMMNNERIYSDPQRQGPLPARGQFSTSSAMAYVPTPAAHTKSDTSRPLLSSIMCTFGIMRPVGGFGLRNLSFDSESFSPITAGSFLERLNHFATISMGLMIL